MSETRSPTEALHNFAKWMEPLEGDQTVQKIYGLTAADAHAVLAQLAAESKRADEAEAKYEHFAELCQDIPRKVDMEHLTAKLAAAEERAKGFVEWANAYSKRLKQFSLDEQNAPDASPELSRFALQVSDYIRASVAALLAAGEEAKNVQVGN
jgi:hypothetical protein